MPKAMSHREMIIQLVEQFKITPFQAEKAIEALQENRELDGEVYEVFFHYYCESGEMPYGTASAKDGDPIEWVYETVAAEIGIC